MNKTTGFNLDKFYSKIYRKYDLINKLFTFGLDRKWRRITIENCLNENPKSVLDLCCGTGDLAIAISKVSKKPISVVGYDMNKSMLDIAKQKSENLNCTELTFVEGNAASMPFEKDKFERVTIGFGFRNLTFNNPKSSKHISEIYRVMKPGGRLLILESGIPKNKMIRFFYKIHLYLILIPLGGIVSGDFKAYWYLAHSSSKFYSLEELRKLLVKFRFKNFTKQSFLFGAANLIMVEK